ncbi:MAG: ABC transporter substrate-binding protein, partial [Campylobacterota bacterium]|nr:ABC transporter substrate-binding protein [Campylobacterota bacterium]
WFHSFQFAGYYMAQEKGFYKEEGLDVELLERNPCKNNIEQVVNSEAEYGVADSTLLLYRAKAKPVKLIAAIFQHSPLVFISKKDSGIYSPYEMKGKRVSFQKGLEDTPYLTMLQSAKITESMYEYRPLDFTTGELIRDEVDVTSAYLSNEPYMLKEKNIEINIINPLNYGVDFYGDTLFTTDKEIETHPARVEAFKKASLKGWDYALSNVDETIEVIKTVYKSKRRI